MDRKTILVLCLTPLLVEIGFSQRRGGPPTEMRRPLNLAGKVVMADGSAVPRGSLVVFNCNGTVLRETYTDPSGQFSLAVRGQAPDTVGSAEISNNADADTVRAGPKTGLARDSLFSQTIGTGAAAKVRMNLSGCRLTVMAAGFTSSSIDLGVRRVLDSPNVGIITLERAGAAKTSAISVNTLAAPPKAKRALEKARKELSRKNRNLSKVEDQILIAVEIYPEFAEAWHLLGGVRLIQGDHEGAEDAYRKAVQADPAFLNPRMSLTQLAVDQEDWTKSAALSHAILELNPGITQARYFESLAQFNLGNLQIAEESAQKAVANEDAESYPGTFYLLGAILAQRGELEMAAVQLRRFLVLKPNAPAADRVRELIQDWEKQHLIAN